MDNTSIAWKEVWEKKMILIDDDPAYRLSVSVIWAKRNLQDRYHPHVGLEYLTIGDDGRWHTADILKYKQEFKIKIRR